MPALNHDCKFHFQVVSDLYLNRVKWRKKHYINKSIKPSCGILLLAGNITRFEDTKTFKLFINTIKNKFKYIIYVPGTYEYISYNGQSTNHLLQKAKQMVQYTNIYILSDNSLTLNLCGQPIRITGSTLWSNIPRVHYQFIQQHYNELKYLYFDSLPLTFNQLNNQVKYHQKSIKFIKKEINVAKRDSIPHIVMTNYAPVIKKCVPPAYEGSIKVINMGNNLNDILDNNLVWVFGRTGWCTDHIHKKTRLISNMKNNTKFKNNFTFNL